jgi:hypothetical protein
VVSGSAMVYDKQCRDEDSLRWSSMASSSGSVCTEDGPELLGVDPYPDSSIVSDLVCLLVGAAVDGLGPLTGCAEDGSAGLAAMWLTGSVGCVDAGSSGGSTGSAFSDCVDPADDGSAGFSGDATAVKPLDDFARKDTQSWFFGWPRVGVQHDERLLAKLEVIVKNSSHANLVVPSPDRSTDMLEELASLDAVRRQDLATAWVQALSG